MSVNNRKVYFIWDENLIKQCDRLPAVSGRATIVNELITSYGLGKYLKVVKSLPASDSDLKLFHSELYIDYLKTFVEIDDEYVPTSQDVEYGIGYDCPPVSDMYNLVSTVAGGSLTAAKCILMGLANVVINWCGGWHHAQRFSAEGFCYVNDIVMAIEKLRIKFPKILYIDLDVHHGNGVQDAYNLSKSVFTLSFHKYEPGFYPGTGNIDETGTLNAKGYSCNFPLHASYTDDTFEYAFQKTFNLVYDHFKPEAIVVQCGADALANDPHGGGGLTIKGYCTCIQYVLDKRKPTMLLGGGGYNFPNAAKLWTSITALAVDVTLDPNIPEHNLWPKYGPDYMLSVQPLLGKDSNTREYLDKCINTIEEQLKQYLACNDEEPLAKRKKENNNKQITNSCKTKEMKCYQEKSCKQTDVTSNKDNVYDFND